MCNFCQFTCHQGITKCCCTIWMQGMACKTHLLNVQAQAQAKAHAAADLLEQISTCKIVINKLSVLQAVMWGMRMNLYTLLDQEHLETMFAKQGGWRTAFVTSRRSKEQLQVSIHNICESVGDNSAFMRMIRQLARPEILNRRAMAKADAKAQAEHRATFEDMLKTLK